ncbi:hypothetical protein P0B80_001403 [Listeria innocua]|uniref:Uncharacterized protein n=2 Tax=Listeria innocua TaxID=1642 RepID=A0AB72ZAY2_LISIO|nr:hypothetical protein [Listeria innocua]EAD5681978.1 hypothetical protein [Listeria innocua]EAG8540031.1 hypothetical protein [Listeria innocua]EAH4437017.1 hypothetical protein [Listeria innocua]EAH4440953.1 hypothetical protein [Listeria innocua]EDO1155743.1 hypothetical protein [Listeria innocua]
MENLFNNNLFFVYLFACIAIVNYASFKENQKILLMYLMTFGLSFLNILNLGMSIVFLLLSTFIYLEFLSNDNEKQIIIVKLGYKLLDYFFIIFFQYHIGWIIFSLLPIFLRNELSNNIDFNWFLEVDVEKISYILSIIAILIFVLGVSRVTAQEFKVKSVDEVIKKYFSPNPIYRRPHSDFSSCYFEMISDMEDKTYFKRKQTYSFLSFEFISIKNKQLSGNTKSLMEYAKKAYKFIKRSKNIRGYSTLEMQLIRILFIEAGYNKKIVRKIFELVYTKIFLQSLKNFYEANVYEHRSEYKKYLLFIYFNNTNTKIAGKSFQSMRNVFPEKEIKDWSNEELFVVCAGLPYRDFTAAEVLSAYQYIIEKYELDRVKIKESIKAIESKNMLG